MKERGHVGYARTARCNKDFYLGGGRQWSPEDTEYMEEVVGAKVFEINEVAEAVNTACGYQIHNRMDITYRARNSDANQETADTLSKVAMQISDNVKLPWSETTVFFDGLVQQRGYYDIRLNFDDSMQGEIAVDVLDPTDVIPDPDAKEYDPDKWQDVVVTRWLTYDELEGLYGTEARHKVEDARGTRMSDPDYGLADADDVPRSKFGTDEYGDYYNYDAVMDGGGIPRVRIIDRQHWKLVPTQVVVFPTGDIRSAEGMSTMKMQELRRRGCIFIKRPMRRVRWTVSAGDVLLHDDWSPYKHFTVVPYFPYFLRGETRGLVDWARSPQELLNKMVTKEAQIVSNIANSGLMVEEDSVTNIPEDDLQTEAGKNGVLFVIAKDAKKWPERLKSAEVPQGVDRLVQLASQKIQRTTGNTDALRGDTGRNQSGVGTQSQQFAAQMPMAVPLDNLSRTRNMVAVRFLELVQDFYDNPRIINITKKDPLTGKALSESLYVNWPDDNGNVLNNLTVGEYDVVITEQPAQITWENSQWNQALELKKLGVNISDEVLIQLSNFSNKAEIIEQMKAGQKANPVDEAKVILLQAQAAAAQAKASETTVQALFGAIRTSQIISAVPQTAAMADSIARSAGVKDADGGSYYPSEAEAISAGPPAPPPPENTNPITSGNATRGVGAGSENGQATIEA